MITVFFRSIIIYLILLFAIRLTGKRQIGELQVSELVVTFMLSELAVYPITDKNVPILYGIIPIISLLCLEVIFSFLQTKSPVFRKVISGKPVVIISRGKLSLGELKKNRLDIEELMGELRLKGIFDISDVEYALLEENGKLSVLPKAASSPMTPSQLGLSSKSHGISHAVIADGQINTAALSSANKTERWLRNFITSESITVDEVFLMTVDDMGCVSLYTKDPSMGNTGLRCQRYSSKDREETI